MKIHLYLINGRVMQLEACTQRDFEVLVQEFGIGKKFFVWNNKLLIRKSEVLGFELVTEEPQAQPPIPE